MSYNLKIQSDIATCSVKLDLIKGEPRKVNGQTILMKPEGAPTLKYKTTAGQLARYVEIDNATQNLLSSGRSSVYVDEDGNQHDKKNLEAFYVTEEDALIPAMINEKTEIFEIKKWEPAINYLDRYQMDKYYQVRPSSGTSKKDYVKQREVEFNTEQMKKLWDYMFSESVVGRGTLNVTSSGYLPSVGYLRAVDPDDTGKSWTFEMAVFKQSKPFSWKELRTWTPTLKAAPTYLSNKTLSSQPHVEDI